MKSMPGHNMAGMESNLLGLGKKVVRVAVERHLADASHRHQFFGNDLGRIEQIEIELVLVLFLDHLHAQFPFREIAVFDGFPQIAPMKVGILTGDLLRFIPDAPNGHQAAVSSGTSRNAICPSALMKRKVWTPNPSIMRKLRGIARSDITHMIMCIDSGISEMKSQNVSCADAAWGISLMWFRLDGMHQIGKLHRILDEEDRNVVADQIVIALLRVELDRKATHVTRQISRPARAHDG